MDAETFERGHLERQGQREYLVRTDAASLPCRCCHHPEDFLQLLTLQTFIRTQQGHCFYVHMVILNTPRAFHVGGERGAFFKHPGKKLTH